MTSKLNKSLSWSEIRLIIDSNRLELFKRSPEGEKEYREFKNSLKSKGISSIARLLGEELHWAKVDSNYNIIETDLKPKSLKLLSNSQDICIVSNKFRYNFDPSIAHLLVWTKVPIESDPSSEHGDISLNTRRLIDRYIEKTFVQGCGIPRDRILWFRNWSKLQSIKNLSHIHVLVKDEDLKTLAPVIGTGGVPLDDRDRTRANL